MRFILVLPACLIPSLPLMADNWPAWRGPKGDGVTAETELPLKWSATEGIRWKIALSERGNSSPIVWGDRVFLTQPVGTRRTLMCLDRKDGRTFWQAGPEWAEKEATHATNPYCSASPVTDGERVIAWFGSAGLWCWSLDGKEQWHVDLGPQHHIWGYAASPVLHGDLCILNFGPGDRSFVVALNKRTGKEVWRFNVPPPAVMEGPGGQPGYAGSWNTGVVAKIGGVQEFLISLPGALYSLDPKTGKELWHCNGLNPVTYCEPLVGFMKYPGTEFTKPYGEVTVPPRAIEIQAGVIAAFGGYGGFSIGVKVDGNGDITAKSRLWQERKTRSASAAMSPTARTRGSPASRA